jgi:hypothetical protein
MSTAFQVDAFQNDAFQIGESAGDAVVSASGSDGHSYYQPKKKHIKRMLKLWGALEEFENYFPAPEPVETVKPAQQITVPRMSDYRKTVAKAKPTAFEWWDKNAKPEPPQWTAKRGSKFEWWKN